MTDVAIATSVGVMVWTGENLFKRFLAEHRGHAGLTTSMSSAGVGPSVASCGCGAFFELRTHADGEWRARVANASRREYAPIAPDYSLREETPL